MINKVELKIFLASLCLVTLTQAFMQELGLTNDSLAMLITVNIMATVTVYGVLSRLNEQDDTNQEDE